MPATNAPATLPAFRGSEAGSEGVAETRALEAEAEAALVAAGSLPPQALDVTSAARFLVEAGKLCFHAGEPILCCL